MSLQSQRSKMYLIASNEVEVVKKARSEVASCAAALVAVEDRAGKLDQQAPAVVPDAKPDIPKELAKIAKGTNVDKLVLLGAGAFGQVYLATNSAKPEEKFALKIANVKRSQPKCMLDQEVMIMEGVSGQPSFLNFYGSWFVKASPKLATPDRFVMKMEFVPFTLHSAVFEAEKNGVEPSLVMLRRLFKHLVDGCKFLHRKGVVHHDIKPENIMVKTPTGRGLDEIEDLGAELLHSTFKLIDFGGAEIVRAANQSVAESHHPQGTKPYMSMAKFLAYHDRSRTYNPFTADAFAVGCTLFCVADPADFVEMMMHKRASAEVWVSVFAHMQRAYLNGNLGQLNDSDLLGLMSHLLTDDTQMFLSVIEEDVY